MFRITSSILTARSLLYRRIRPDSQVQCLNSTSQNWKYQMPKERDTCPEPKPPPKQPPKEDAAFWGAITLLLLSGGFIVYAKSNPEIRDWILIRASWLDDLIAVLFQENCTYSETARQCISDIKSALDGFLKEDKKPKECSQKAIPAPCSAGSKNKDKTGQSKSQSSPSHTFSKDVDFTEDFQWNFENNNTECSKIPAPIKSTNICEVENCFQELAETALANYLTARDACIYYNKLVGDTMINFNVSDMKALRDAMEERKALVLDSIGTAECAILQLDELSRLFECGAKEPFSTEVVNNTKNMVKDFNNQIALMKMQYQWENDKSTAIDCQWQKVEKLIDKYTSENMAMSSGLTYMGDKPFLSGDPDLLLHHTIRFVAILKEQLADALEAMKERTSRAVDALPQGEEQAKARKRDMDALYAKKIAELDGEFKKRADDAAASNAERLKNKLKEQLDEMQQILIIKLEKKEIEANKKLEKMVAKQVEVEKNEMANELRQMNAQVKAIEDKLNASLKAEQETRRSQDLYRAGASLLAATKKGDPLVRVDKELAAIEKASGDGDKLVVTVLKSIPKSVREKGVVPETVLRQKYHLMEDVALKVALVEREGGAFPVYILSYIQSWFLFMKISGIPQKDFETPPTEPEDYLDTFDLLQRARFWIDRGNVAAAIKYVSALEGASRAAAATWEDAARSHLEIRQAAEAVLAHATALGLKYV